MKTIIGEGIHISPITNSRVQPSSKTRRPAQNVYRRRYHKESYSQEISQTAESWRSRNWNCIIYANYHSPSLFDSIIFFPCLLIASRATTCVAIRQLGSSSSTRTRPEDGLFWMTAIRTVSSLRRAKWRTWATWSMTGSKKAIGRKSTRRRRKSENNQKWIVVGLRICIQLYSTKTMSDSNVCSYSTYWKPLPVCPSGTPKNWCRHSWGREQQDDLFLQMVPYARRCITGIGPAMCFIPPLSIFNYNCKETGCILLIHRSWVRETQRKSIRCVIITVSGEL